MHKLIILIEKTTDPQRLERHWPDFLRLAERLPGLRRETTSWSESLIFGDYDVTLVHELYFDTLEDLQAALASTLGQAAGRMLQFITEGKMTLLFAQHQEDDLENIRKHQKAAGSQDGDAHPA